VPVKDLQDLPQKRRIVFVFCFFFSEILLGICRKRFLPRQGFSNELDLFFTSYAQKSVSRYIRGAIFGPLRTDHFIEGDGLIQGHRLRKSYKQSVQNCNLTSELADMFGLSEILLLSFLGLDSVLKIPVDCADGTDPKTSPAADWPAELTPNRPPLVWLVELLLPPNGVPELNKLATPAADWPEELVPNKPPLVWLVELLLPLNGVPALNEVGLVCPNRPGWLVELPAPNDPLDWKEGPPAWLKESLPPNIPLLFCCIENRVMMATGSDCSLLFFFISSC